MTSERPHSSQKSRRFRIAVASVIGTVLVRALGLTWKIRFENEARWYELHSGGKALALALWHGELLPLTWCHRKFGVSALISSHADGEIIARIVTSLGFTPIRGSTSRGGARALMEAVAHLRQGRDVAFTTDGPRGPRRVSSPGVAVAAAKAECLILPVGALVSRAWIFRSWDRFVVPKPFATITIRYADPIQPAGNRAGDGEAVVPLVDEALLRVCMPDNG